eukprot:CAMPEP_0198134904 /NCGR_PEP_ID=MMETSP1442-20131203/60318_1 /TAXON_ID= /ORGANISM="Craspedostauros australis, Strain CCMP3328" /LENGTH=58 /DNA_ID=CAMNT_0043796061 /DNA_START=1 /DNA_END=177 /DNA_ORIENTATION=-
MARQPESTKAAIARDDDDADDDDADDDDEWQAATNSDLKRVTSLSDIRQEDITQTAPE